MCELFQETEQPYNLRNNHIFRTHNVKTVQCGIETLLFMGPAEAVLQRCSYEKVFWKYAANLQESNHSKLWLQ